MSRLPDARWESVRLLIHDVKIRDQEIDRLKAKNRKITAKMDQVASAGQSLLRFIPRGLNPWADKAVEDWEKAISSLFRD